MPSVAGFGLLTLVPILFSLAISFTDWNFLNGLTHFRFVGITNFARMWSDEWFLASIRNNFVYTGVTVPATMALAIVMATGLNRGLFLQKTIRLMVFMPYITSVVAVSIVWSILYHPTLGPINELLRFAGVSDPPGWLSTTAWALPGVMLMGIWSHVGYNVVIYLAGLQNIPKDLYEAATIDGAGPFASFRYITLPMLSPTTFFVLIINIIQSFQVFGAIYVMTQGGPGHATSVLTFYIYQTGFQFYDMGYASAMAWIMFLLIFAVTAIQWTWQKRWVNY
ncbi:MAG: sugar ABC transporter permease [Paenibacillaceae bacterium]|nr:sugar ABC transporter permease [Paenibacillaceae bacterium]